jgi:hypothetical protein
VSAVTCAASGKIRYRKRSSAHRVAKEIERKGRVARRARESAQMVEYQCEHCGDWHVANHGENIRPTHWHRT